LGAGGVPALLGEAGLELIGEVDGLRPGAPAVVAVLDEGAPLCAGALDVPGAQQHDPPGVRAVLDHDRHGVAAGGAHVTAPGVAGEDGLHLAPGAAAVGAAAHDQVDRAVVVAEAVLEGAPRLGEGEEAPVGRGDDRGDAIALEAVRALVEDGHAVGLVGPFGVVGRGGAAAEQGCGQREDRAGGEQGRGAHAGHPFTAPVRTPLAKWRCRNGYTMRIGTMETTRIAICSEDCGGICSRPMSAWPIAVSLTT